MIDMDGSTLTNLDSQAGVMPAAPPENTNPTEEPAQTTQSTNVEPSVEPDDRLGALRDYLPADQKQKSIGDIPTDVLETAYKKMMDELKNNRDLPNEVRNRIMNIAYASSGGGGYFNQLQTFMSCLDRYGTTVVTPNTEMVGATFITRPRLCLQSSNIRNNRMLTALDTLNVSSMAFAIRCLLDTNFGKANNGLRWQYVAKCQLVDYMNPFLVPVCNALKSFSGSPAIQLSTEATEGGFMNEAQTYVIGGDNLQRGNYGLNLTFSDVQYGPIMAIFLYWIEYIRCVTRGILQAYADDVDAQRLNYTVSIYRFLLDPTHRYITKYAKYTGCFPESIDIGAAFNFGQGDTYVSSLGQFSVPFICNKVEYMDYAILMDFNTLVRRYCPNINKMEGGKEHEPQASGEQAGKLLCPNLPISPLTNWRGIPYVTTDPNGFRLEYRRVQNQTFDSTPTIAEQLLYLDMQQKAKMDSAYARINNLYTPEFMKESEGFKIDSIQKLIEEAFKQKANSDTLNGI